MLPIKCSQPPWRKLAVMYVIACGREGVLTQNRFGLRLRILFNQRVHFSLQGALVFDQPDPGVPGVRGVPRFRLDLTPCAGMLLLKGCHKLLYVTRHGKFRVHPCQHEDVGRNVGALRALVIDLSVRSKKNHKIDENQRQGDYRPAAALHVFMPQWNEHLLFLPS
jgi:hypothetical protein